MYHFHVNLFADPKEASFACTWEDAAAKLERLPGMLFELDGSFVVSGDDVVGRRWHVDGHLFDFAGSLHRWSSTANVRRPRSTICCAASVGRDSRSCSS